MARQRRTDPEAGMHHIFTRGTRRWSIFLDDHDRRCFLGMLDRACDRYGIWIIAYCLMDNHVHLVVQCPDGNISAAMRDLKSLYARLFNQRHRSSGPIFEDRFGSKLITSHLQLREVVRYVHRNPYAISRHLKLDSFRWSSHPVYLGVSPRPNWLRPDLALPLFDGYRTMVETPRPNDAVKNVPHGRYLVSAVPDTPTLGSAQPALAEILVAVARAAGCPVADVHPSRRNGLIGLAVLLAREHARYTIAELYEPFGYRTASGAERAGQRARRQKDEQPKLEAVWQGACGELWPAAA